MILNISFNSNSDKKREGEEKNGSKAGALTKPTISEENIDYTLPENYAVDFFCNHRVSKKKNTGGFELKARWKGFTEGEDTWEPITNQAKDNPALVKSDLMKISAKEADPLNQL